MNAAQNSQRWAVDQRSKVRAAFAESVRRADDERRERFRTLKAAVAAANNRSV